MPVLGIATCAGFGQDTALELVLSSVLADEPPESAVAAIGYGGLLEGLLASRDTRGTAAVPHHRVTDSGTARIW